MRLNIRHISLLIVSLIAINLNLAQAQEKKTVKIGCIGFYNIENLYDTINQEDILDDEFTPDGVNKWNGDKYRIKLKNISEIVSQI